ncbi:hypothetical protein EON65_03975, partial [archaeon]
MLTAEETRKLTVNELKEELKARGALTSGKKQDLLDRLIGLIDQVENQADTDSTLVKTQEDSKSEVKEAKYVEEELTSMDDKAVVEVPETTEGKAAQESEVSEKSDMGMEKSNDTAQLEPVVDVPVVSEERENKVDNGDPVIESDKSNQAETVSAAEVQQPQSSPAT